MSKFTLIHNVALQRLCPMGSLAQNGCPAESCSIDEDVLACRPKQ